MDLEKIKELMAAMEDKGMTKVVLKEKDGFEIELERGGAFEFSPYQVPQMAPTPQVETTPQKALPQQENMVQTIEPQGGHEVTSPMVGTFYASPSPDDGPFIKVGDTVSEDTVIGIIEAMKVMNEIKAGKKGVVVEMYVGNAQPVEFGTRIIKLTES